MWKMIGKFVYKNTIIAQVVKSAPIFIIFWVICLVIYLVLSVKYAKNSGKRFKVYFMDVIRIRFRDVLLFFLSYMFIVPTIQKFSNQDLGLTGMLAAIVPAMVISNGLGLILLGMRNSGKNARILRRWDRQNTTAFVDDIQYSSTSRHTAGQARRLQMPSINNTRTDLFGRG